MEWTGSKIPVLSVFVSEIKSKRAGYRNNFQRIIEMKQKIENTNAARYAKLNHEIYKSILRAYQKALVDNAVIMNHDDEKLLVTIARDYTEFMHSEKFDLNKLSERRERLFPIQYSNLNEDEIR